MITEAAFSNLPEPVLPDRAAPPPRAVDPAEVTRLIEAHRGWIVKEAVRLSGPGVAIDDLIQEGRIGVMIAAERFEPERGASFLAYAKWWIFHRQSRFAYSTRETIRVPLARAPELRVKAVSLDAPASESGDGDFHELVGAEAPERMLYEADAEPLLTAALDRLPERHRRILRARFWEGKTLEEIGREIGRTRERTRQIEADALTLLRANPLLREVAP